MNSGSRGKSILVQTPW